MEVGDVAATATKVDCRRRKSSSASSASKATSRVWRTEHAGTGTHRRAHPDERGGGAGRRRSAVEAAAAGAEPAAAVGERERERRGEDKDGGSENIRREEPAHQTLWRNVTV
ncbi:hypothetical protein OsI_18781 [Oryza sativa Indica Group]|uniref:Uncharacterized protein n=2 Tax=Oryza sativa TaxID=4530 RepID=B9FMY0_ORYSJ|nr:hypothetical protein OsI_18781 [Oryza sativa Indica Group]EEE62642.1 hypothetical protein OsJ_17445 [Oryza sativa Japonica Group]